MKNNSEKIELFKLIVLATNGNTKAKWKIIWKFQNLINKVSSIDGVFNEECQEYVEKTIFKNIEKFKTLENIKNNKKI